MKTGRWPKVVGMFLIALGLLRPIASLAQLPPLPPIPTDPYLDSWSFYDPTNWFSDLGYAPIAFTNIFCDESCWASDDGVLDCNGLLLDSTNTAFLNYNVVEHDGNTNLICSSGTIWFWFSPDWSSTNQGGTGPGDWGRFIDVGAWTSNANYGWWSVFLSPDGDNIYFSGQTNGVGTNYLNFPISWAANSWHLIGLTYTDTNSILYVDGQLATNGLGVSYWPGHDILTNGFWIGSDFSGVEQARGEFVDVETWANQFSSNHFAGYYNHILPELPGGGFTMDDGPPSPGGGGDTNYDGGTGGGASPDGLSSLYNSTNLWLWMGSVSSNQANLALMNSAPDILYEIQGRTNLVQGDWISESFVNGSELTNWTPTSALATNQGTMFYRIRSWVDSNNSGIPDWWWLTYFGQITNVDANASAANDGFSNLQKFQMGLNPTNYYNSNSVGGFFGCLDATGTNVVIEWSNAPGPVANYIIQRGIYNPTNGNYVYSQIGMVSSNATFFKDVGAITNDNAWNNIYNLQAAYLGGGLTGTDTWYAWYAEYGWSGLPYGAPVPNNVYAYANSTGTNVQLSWTAPTQGMPTNYIIERGTYDTGTGNYDYSQIASLNTNTTFFQDVGVINGDNDWNDIYEVEAVYPGGGLSQPVSASISTTPPSPTGLSATVDSTGTNVQLAWTPPQGVTVTNYTVERGIYNTNTGSYDYTQVGQVNGSTTSFEDMGAIASGSSYNYSYEVEAFAANGNVSGFDYANLNSPPPPATFNANIYITARLVRNGTGRWQVMFSGFPTNSAQAIQLTWTDGNGNATLKNISTTNLINGIYPIADTDVVNLLGDSLSVQLFGPNGEPGQVAQAGVLANDAPYFVDGRQHMKQNLNFLIRAASLSQPFGTYDQNDYQFNQSATNFEEFSFLHHDWQDPYPTPIGPFAVLDNLWPFIANDYLANFFVDATRTNLYENPYGTNDFFFQPNFTTNVPAPAILTHSDPYWVLQPGFSGSPYGYTATNWGVSVTSTQTVASLQSGLYNLFGLPEQSGCAVDANPAEVSIDGVPTPILSCIYQPLATGDSVTTEQASNHIIEFYASWCPAPALQFVNYYFAPLINPNLDTFNLPANFDPYGGNVVQPFPLPIFDDFAVTNQTPPLIVGTVGQPMILGAWAKYSISNSIPTKYAYLGQYFATNAFLLNASGGATTNSAGVLSPYGEFFPLQAGVAALVTMPDIDTGQQGTNVVRVVGLSADANHDGTLDFTYQGPDFVSASKPFRFWIDDTSDAGDFGGTGIPGQGAQGNGMLQIQRQWKIHGRRDLANCFPVYINIGSLFQSNALSTGISATDANWQFVLSQADGVLRFAYTDLTPTNYMNFLRDTNESGNLANASLTTITNAANGGVTLSQSFIGGIATNNQGIILVEAAASTTQPLVLTIYHGTNQIAQTSLYLSISGVEQMFRHKSLMLNPNVPVLPNRLTDADVPNEPDTINANFVFLHGYNVLPNEARGVAADMFKRMYWSGSHAKFYAVTWEGADTKGTWPFYNLFTPNYHTNVVNAFLTAPNLVNFLGTLSGSNVVAAHSLGNMVVLSSISDWNAPISQYFMMDAAVPMEAIDPTSSTTNMVYSASSAPWLNYNNALWASKWFNVWPSSDARYTLTWSNRVGNLQNVGIYNFFSSGEEVLREYDSNPPSSVLGAIVSELLNAWPGGLPFGTYAWVWQEKGKGTCSQDWFIGSSHGGWGLNENLNSGYVFFVNGLRTNIPPAVITNSVLQTNAFFDMSVDTAMFTASSSGSTYAATNRNRILSDAIPALSLPVGANHVSRLAPLGQPDRNTDMMTLENGWPIGRGPASWPTGTTAFGEWHHSDFHQVAYTFTYQLFNQMVTTGNLK